MFGYRRKSFNEAHRLLENIRNDQNDFASLLALQRLLYSEIARAEKSIRKLKKELRSVASAENKSSRKRSEYLRSRVSAFQYVSAVWRWFGDSIAFIYLDKYALKQVYYNIDNGNPRQGSGFISDKKGIASEIAFLELAVSNGVPALLTDLTNTIRYGDVCLLGGSDPYLVEVKSSNRLDKRGRRQLKSIERLKSFFETDKADALRGSTNVQRVESAIPENNYVEDLNSCIAEAIESGLAIRNPEKGLFYVALTNSKQSIEDAFKKVELQTPWAFLLNEFKSENKWAPYTPFVLTIRNREHLWRFIQDKVYIVILIDPQSLCDIAREQGYDSTFDRDDEEYPLQFKSSEMEHPGKTGLPMLLRIAFEFVSPRWVVLNSIEMLKWRMEQINLER